ncbi:MAG: hypothetical protein M0R66_00510 [Candidatus Omnitrophica bacterium]|nr:hypothetical protein [Candidatus Omnitrophota bacterium]
MTDVSFDYAPRLAERIGGVLRGGDEFARDEYPDLAPFQISPARANGNTRRRGNALPRTKSSGIVPARDVGAQARDRPTSADESIIEVYDTARQFTDIYSAPDADKERLFMLDVDGDRALARHFVVLANHAAITRATFRRHPNPEIMARQLILIAQDSRLFPAPIIVPRCRPITTETFAERARKSNLMQIIRGKTVRAHRITKRITAIPTITIATAVPLSSTSQGAPATTQPRARETTGIQFPQRIIATMAGTQRDAIATVIPPNISVEIMELAFAPSQTSAFAVGVIPGALAITTIGAQPERPAFAFDPREPYLPRIISMASDSVAPAPAITPAIAPTPPPATYAKIFLHLRLLFQQYYFARPDATTAPHADDRDFADNAQGEEIDVVPTDPRAQSLFEIARLLGFALPYARDRASIIADFMRAGASDTYFRIAHLDDPAPAAADAAETIRAAAASRAATVRAIADHRANMNRLEILASLIEDNFPRKIARSIARDPFGGMGPEIGNLVARGIRLRVASEHELFARLSPDERAFILASYAAFRRTAPARAHCEHMRAVATLARSTTARAIADALAVLSKILANAVSENPSAMIKCALCSQDAICPHTLDIANVIAQHGTRKNERDRIAQYIDRIPGRGLYYCRICGAQFEHALAVSDDVDRATSENKELADDILREINMISRFIRATRVTDQAAFARNVAQHIYPHIEMIEGRIAIAQTSLASELSARLRVYIAIYVFADAIVNAERMGIIFDGVTLPRDSDDKRARAILIKNAIDKIALVENVALNQIPGFTRDVIGARISAAIRELGTVAADMPFESPPRDYRAVAMYDPLIAIIHNACPGIFARQATAAPSLALARGVLPSLALARGVLPSLARNNKDPFDYEYAALAALPEKPSDPKNILAPLFARCSNARSGIVARLREIIEHRLFDYAIATTDRAITDIRARHSAENAAQRAAESVSIARAGRADGAATRVPEISIIRAHAPPFSSYNTPTRARTLGAVYDENGVAHVWNVLIFAPTVAPGPIIEVKFGSPEASDAFARADIAYIDKKCAACGILQSKTSALDDRAIRAAIDARAAMENFYQFYEARCPADGPHAFASSTDAIAPACTKCGYSSALARSYDRAYFDRHIAKFREHIASPAPITTIAGRRVSKRDEDIDTIARAIARQPWSLNYEILVDAAAVFGIERRDFQTLGAREGLTRDKLADESYVAPVPKSSVSARIFALRSYIFEIFALYNVIRGDLLRSGRRGAITRSVAQFADDLKREYASGGPAFDRAASELPPLGDIVAPIVRNLEPDGAGASAFASDIILARVILMFAEHYHDKTAKIVDFYLETLCRVLSALAQYKPRADGAAAAPSRPLTAVFARTFVAHLFARENITIRGDRFSLSVVEGTKLANDDFDIAASDPAAMLYDEYEDAGAEIVPADDDARDGETDPFSLDSFDLDHGDDDADDGPVVIRIGNDVGW